MSRNSTWSATTTTTISRQTDVPASLQQHTDKRLKRNDMGPKPPGQVQSMNEKGSADLRGPLERHFRGLAYRVNPATPHRKPLN